MPKNQPNVFDDQAITANEFLTTHWQRSPYLFTQTSIDLSGLPDINTLFELAAIEDVQSRIVYTEDDIRYQAIYDEPDAWQDVKHQKPTLLVSDIEKWYPQAMALMDWFPFIKSWRFDDLMMSYAPAGSSVGAHTDHYDVFLLQVQGTRQWSYDKQPLVNFELVEDSELAVIDNYKAQETHELKAGDVLYLPPEIPHHGVSTSDDCVTCSIGLRAPSKAELLMAVTELASQHMAAADRFKDAVIDTAMDASIGPNEINYLRQQLQNLSQLDDKHLALLFGQFITSYRLFNEVPESQTSTDNGWLQKNPFAVFAYHINSDSDATLFVNGEAFHTSVNLARRICDRSKFQLDDLKTQATNQMADHRLIQQLIATHALIARP